MTEAKSDWTTELKEKVVRLYTEGKPTPENSMTLVEQIAEQLGKTVNGVRMILTKAGVYVKKESAPKKEGSKDKPKTTRVSKEASASALIVLLKEKNLPVDEDIINKLTGKAMVYFTNILKG